MKRKIGAQEYIECESSQKFRVVDVFMAAIKYSIQYQLQKQNESDQNKQKIEDSKEKKKLEVSKSNVHEIKDSKQKIKLEVSELIIQENEKSNNKNKEIQCFIGEDDEKFHICIEKISKNQISISYKVIDIKNNRTMCKKVILPEEYSFKHLQNAMKEFEVLLSIDHPCICKTYGINPVEVIQSDDPDIEGNNDDDDESITTAAIFLEYLDFSLKELINKKKLTNTLKARIVIEIVHGMIHIHKLGYIHRDLKAENIRLDSLLRAKIADFGFVKINESLFENYSQTQSSIIKAFGSAIYMSPELINNESYDSKTDVYSFGIILYYIFTGNLPHCKVSDIMKKKPIQLPSPSSDISEFCVKLISNCLNFDPEGRPSFEDILNQIRENNYLLASNVDQNYVILRDQELSF